MSKYINTTNLIISALWVTATASTISLLTLPKPEFKMKQKKYPTHVISETNFQNYIHDKHNTNNESCTYTW